MSSDDIPIPATRLAWITLALCALGIGSLVYAIYDRNALYLMIGGFLCGLAFLGWLVDRSPSWVGRVGLFFAVLGLFGACSLLMFQVREWMAEEALEVAWRIRQIGIAIHNYENDHGHLPQPAIYSKDGQPLLSWRVALLPYLEEQELYNQFHLDEPWDSPHNIQLLARRPDLYANGRRRPTPSRETTYFQVFTGPDTLFADVPRVA
jgi:hypothetical protein